MTQQRKRSKSGFYHVVLKGNGARTIFEDDDDRRSFLKILVKARDDHALKFHAWCLMTNHVHLIIEDPARELADAMRDIVASYAVHYNDRHSTTGSLFQDHFWSEPIEHESYLLTAMNYVHHNPQAAGMAMTETYRWSSYQDYAAGSGDRDLTETKLLLGMLDGVSGFLRFSQRAPTVKAFPESALTGHLTDGEFVIIAGEILGITAEDVGRLATMAADRREKAACVLARQEFTHAQIAKLTGISRRRLYTLQEDDAPSASND